MPNGGKLAITARSFAVSSDLQLASGDYVELAVVDTGSGMPDSVMSRAFDPFFTTKGVGKGTGLGLSQVYGMARHAGGTARIESRPGAGTKVAIILRQAAPPDERGVGSDSDAEREAATAAILVVDDDAEVRALLSDMLPALGYAAVFEANGPDALAALERAPTRPPDPGFRNAVDERSRSGSRRPAGSPGAQDPVRERLRRHRPDPRGGRAASNLATQALQHG